MCRFLACSGDGGSPRIATSLAGQHKSAGNARVPWSQASPSEEEIAYENNLEVTSVQFVPQVYHGIDRRTRHFPDRSIY